MLNKLFLLCLCLLVGACAAPVPAEAPVIVPFNCHLGPGEEFPLSLKGSFPADAAVSWEANKGNFKPEKGINVVYTASPEVGMVNVTASITANKTKTTANIVCTISLPVAPATPVQPAGQEAGKPVLAPDLTATPALTPTLQPTTEPTASPSPTATPGPQASITNVAGGDSIPQLITLMGSMRSDLNDAVWIFVQDPNGLYYPQSMDPCNGTGTPHKNGVWEMHMDVGTAESAGVFNLVLTIAGPQADRFIATTLQNQCINETYAGFAELPPGLVEVQRLPVTRFKAERPVESFGPAPALLSSGPVGQVTVAGLAEGSEVAQEETLSGAVSGIPESAKVWVLVYTYFGRWYPQSIDACKGLHTLQAQGQWQSKAVFGGSQDQGKPFDLVVVVADEEADKSLTSRQQEWCLGKSYPGLLTIDLPEGISEKFRARVIRK